MLRLFCTVSIVISSSITFCLPPRLAAQSTGKQEITKEQNVDQQQLSLETNGTSNAFESPDSTVNERAPETAHIPVICEVPDVQIKVNGELAGQTPLSGPLAVPIGVIRVVFTRNGYIEKTKTVTVSKGPNRPLPCEMELERPLNMRYAAMLVVNVSEFEADVRVDGKAFSLKGILPNGRHVLEVRLNGFKTWRRTIALMARHKHTVAVRLIPERDYYTRYVASSESQRIWSYILGGAGIALGSVTIGVAIWNHTRYDQWRDEEGRLNEDFQVLPPYPSELVERQRENDCLLDSIHTVDMITIGAALAGGALFITGLVLFLSGDDPDKYEDRINSNLMDIRRDAGLFGWRAVW
jgi:hypothetical protein